VLEGVQGHAFPRENGAYGDIHQTECRFESVIDTAWAHTIGDAEELGNSSIGRSAWLYWFSATAATDVRNIQVVPMWSKLDASRQNLHKE
jgi:hypothetical protein